MSEQRRLKRLSEASVRGGPGYAALFAARHALSAVVNWFDERLVGIEQRRRIVEPWAILSKRLTTDENRRMWNGYDWSALGEEWTRSPDWKATIVREFIDPYFQPGGTFIEIGPGGGKWTAFLQPRARKLILVDVAEVPLQLCRERFRNDGSIEYRLGDGRTLPVDSSSIDAIWSFDCFVHINPLDVRSYFEDFSRVLVPGGVACIHHAGPPVPGLASRPGNRSDMTDRMAREFAEGARLHVVSQSNEHVNARDVVTVLRRPK